MEREIDELLESLGDRMTNGTQRKVYEDLVNQIAGTLAVHCHKNLTVSSSITSLLPEF